MQYTVQQGDCMSSIGFANGFFWKTLWELGDNAALKALRKNPNVLLAGDVVFIPDLQTKQVAGAPNARHQFKKKGVPELLRMKLLDGMHQPRPNLEYVIVIDGISSRGTTDANGQLVEGIPPNAQEGTLTFAADSQSAASKGKMQVLNLKLGTLNPVTVTSGLKARLSNLRFYKGPIDENLDDDTQRAIRAFQRRKGLPVTGAADDATQAQLLQAHGH
jgi:hypothetical protein